MHPQAQVTSIIRSVWTKPNKGPWASPCCQTNASCSQYGGCCQCCTKGRWGLCLGFSSLSLALLSFILFAIAPFTTWQEVKIQKFTSRSSTPYYRQTQDIKLTAKNSKAQLCTNSTPFPPFNTACVTCSLVRSNSALFTCSTTPTTTIIPAYDALASESARAGAVGSANASPVFAILYLLLVAFFILPLMGDIARMSQSPGLDFGHTFSPLPRLPCVYNLRAHSCWGIMSALVAVTLSCALGLSAIAVFGTAFNDPMDKLFKATCPLPAGVPQGTNNYTPPPGFSGTICTRDSGPGYLLSLFGFVFNLISGGLLLLALLCGWGWLFCGPPSTPPVPQGSLLVNTASGGVVYYSGPTANTLEYPSQFQQQQHQHFQAYQGASAWTPPGPNDPNFGVVSKPGDLFGGGGGGGGGGGFTTASVAPVPAGAVMMMMAANQPPPQMAMPYTGGAATMYQPAAYWQPPPGIPPGLQAPPGIALQTERVVEAPVASEQQPPLATSAVATPPLEPTQQQ